MITYNGPTKIWSKTNKVQAPCFEEDTEKQIEGVSALQALCTLWLP